MKLFISQPMNGKTVDEILEVRAKAIESAMTNFDTDVEVIDSFFQGAPSDAKPLWFLGESLKLMADADVVYFAKGWEGARGCKIEYEAALAYGLNIILGN
jgi:hypothetical protein